MYKPPPFTRPLKKNIFQFPISVLHAQRPAKRKNERRTFFIDHRTGQFCTQRYDVGTNSWQRTIGGNSNGTNEWGHFETDELSVRLCVGENARRETEIVRVKWRIRGRCSKFTARSDLIVRNSMKCTGWWGGKYYTLPVATKWDAFSLSPSIIVALCIQKKQNKFNNKLNIRTAQSSRFLRRFFDDDRFLCFRSRPLELRDLDRLALRFDFFLLRCLDFFRFSRFALVDFDLTVCGGGE